MILKVTSRIARWGRLLFLPRFGCRRSHLPERNNNLTFLVIFSIFLASASQAANAIQLSSDSQLATAGYFQLLWSGQNKDFQLQESFTPDFQSYKVIYEGQDLARVVSGKSNGDYFYRVASIENSSSVSNVLKVSVQHHSLANAVMFFVAGAIVFISTIVLIIKGNKQANN